MQLRLTATSNVQGHNRYDKLLLLVRHLYLQYRYIMNCSQKQCQPIQFFDHVLLLIAYYYQVLWFIFIAPKGSYYIILWKYYRITYIICAVKWNANIWNDIVTISGELLKPSLRYYSDIVTLFLTLWVLRKLPQNT